MKLKVVVSAVAFSLLAASAWAQEQTQVQVPEKVPEAAPATEAVVITGQRPGPGMWKVTKGEHVLWVFGKYAPLPKQMEWRSHEVEAVLAKSQEYLSAPTSEAGVGVWGGLKLVAALPQIWNIEKNPDGATLQQIVPPETYARWAALKEKYMAKDKDVERYRPIFAATSLFEHGLKHTGLATKDEVDPAINKLVKQSKIKVTPSSISVDMSDASKLLKEFTKSNLDDAACFASTLSRLEADIDHMRARANAWAIGDIETIRKLDYADHESTCRAAVEGSAAFQSRPELIAARAKSHDIWLVNAEKALENNASTFAVLRMQDILSPTGLLARLQAKGYKVEAPE